MLEPGLSLPRASWEHPGPVMGTEAWAGSRGADGLGSRQPSGYPDCLRRAGGGEAVTGPQPILSATGLLSRALAHTHPVSQ